MTFSPELETKFAKLMGCYPPGRQRAALIPMLMFAQDETGCITPELVAEVAARLSLDLDPTPDILAEVGRQKGGRLLVGFAAETGDPLAEAQRKLVSKGLDLIVANDVTRPDAGFAVDTNRVTLLSPDEQPADLPLQSKLDVGRAIVLWLENHFRS